MPLFKSKQGRAERLEDLMAQVRAVRETAASEAASSGLQSFLVEQDSWPASQDAEEPVSAPEPALSAPAEPPPEPSLPVEEQQAVDHEALLEAELQRYLARERRQDEALSRERDLDD